MDFETYHSLALCCCESSFDRIERLNKLKNKLAIDSAAYCQLYIVRSDYLLPFSNDW